MSEPVELNVACLVCKAPGVASFGKIADVTTYELKPPVGWMMRHEDHWPSCMFMLCPSCIKRMHGGPMTREELPALESPYRWIDDGGKWAIEYDRRPFAWWRLRNIDVHEKDCELYALVRFANGS